tara:strand:+ start:102 stop:266 length:165 start_codon:yes stop_codon:yes gene_type:complete
MIKKWIEKIFGKFCQCKDEHIEFYEDVPKEKIKIVCEKHPNSYKKTCPSCRQAA